jgi:hypothetical protein
MPKTTNADIFMFSALVAVDGVADVLVIPIPDDCRLVRAKAANRGVLADVNGVLSFISASGTIGQTLDCDTVADLAVHEVEITPHVDASFKEGDYLRVRCTAAAAAGDVDLVLIFRR